MFRLLIGSVAGGIVQFMIGGIAWMVFSGHLVFGHLQDATTADLQTALARTLTPTGTGTYFVPMPETPAATTLYGRGPVALIFFNTHGFTLMNPGLLLVGLILSVLMLFFVGLALRHVVGAAARLQVAALFAVAMVGYFVLSMPVFNASFPWGWWVMLGIEELVAFGAAVFILVRWFMPVPNTL